MLTRDASPSRRIAARPRIFRGLFLLTLFTFLASAIWADSEGQRLRIVFEISSDTAFEGFVANVEGLQENFSGLAEITVVACSTGVGLLRAPDNPLQRRLANLADRGVDFVACEDGLRESDPDGGEILPFARTVRSGPEQLDLLEQQGWARVRDGESYVSHL